jgi:translocation and assembly module TamB
MHPLRQLGRITARIVAWTAGIALGLVLLAGIAVTIVLSTEGGTRTLAGLLDERSFGGQMVTLEGVSGSFQQAVAVDRLSLSDDDGEWLEVRELKLQWRPADLLRGRVQIGLLTAQRVTTKRAPAAAEPDDTDPEPIKLPRIPDLPIRLVIDHLGVGELSLPRGPGTA